MLVDVSGVSIFSHALAELVQSLDDCFLLRGRAECISIPLLWVAVNAFVVSEQLWQVLGSSVGDGPFEFRWIEDFLLSFLTIFAFYRFGRHFFGFFAFHNFFDLFLDFFFFENFKFVINELGLLLFELQ